MSNAREALHADVVVVFQRSDGRVIGTFVHGSRESPDPTDLERSRDRFMKELQEERGREVELDSVVVPLQELAGRWIARVDPKTHKIVKSGPTTGGPILFR